MRKSNWIPFIQGSGWKKYWKTPSTNSIYLIPICVWLLLVDILYMDPMGTGVSTKKTSWNSFLCKKQSALNTLGSKKNDVDRFGSIIYSKNIPNRNWFSEDESTKQHVCNSFGPNKTTHPLKLTASSPLKIVRGPQKERIVFQPSIFRC